ncbi:hypothetical protein GCM10010112_82550 [Actinoplanes lobatus]|uniref:Putative membrane protein n=1 Tax=Actinoplanes lobatus TaxID=113568 RepID=A0A7W7HL49_9ACTN|nr:hypothetical protein [Actinoplanes lobatus]MBB4752558.1 putative membrane protein [Actinoplanes lobatus]GGN93839.1 hypothetical protein GCM10010112_82550 [Actinoplanes lobatus]GIE44856.1 hypothetical protein Alo02nite_77540 [Actinoplanes lobatus]
MAAALAALTAWAAAQLAPTTWIHTAQAGDDSTTGALLRRGYFGAAALGLAIAGLWGLGAGVGVGFTDETFLRTALTAAVPISICAAVIALAAPRLPQTALTTWLRRARPPVTAIAVGAAGVYLQRAADTLTFPADLAMPGLVQAVGAAMLGVATALIATRSTLLRIITGIILATGYVLVTDVTTHHYLTIAYTIVLAWWAATTATVTVTAAIPQAAGWLSRKPADHHQ